MDTGDATVGAAQVGAAGPDHAGRRARGGTAVPDAELSAAPVADKLTLYAELSAAPGADKLTLSVNEVFGPTVQGEGPAAGRHCVFLRLAMCNLRCRWCDTAYTWAFTEDLAAYLDRPRVYDRADNARTMTIPEVLDGLRGCWPLDKRKTTVVISGGEPLIQQDALLPLVRQLKWWDNDVHVETAGTIAPTVALAALTDLFVVSPKLAHSGNPRSKRIRPPVLETFVALKRRAAFKFVVTDVEDLAEVEEIVACAKIPDSRVMIMPEGVTAQAVTATGRAVADAVRHRGWGLCLRTHILLWADVRGR
jgi:organic radical activating enzyme